MKKAMLFNVLGWFELAATIISIAVPAARKIVDELDPPRIEE